MSQQYVGGDNVFDVQVYTDNSIEDGWKGIFTDRYYVIPTHIKVNSINGDSDYIVRDFIIDGDVAFENGTDADTRNTGTRDATINLDTNNIGLSNMAADKEFHHCNLKVYLHKASFNLTADPNGGTLKGDNFGADNGTSNSHTVTVKYGQTDYSALGTAERSGYTFDGWYTSPSGGTKVYDGDGNCVTGDYWNSENKFIGNSNLTVYAHWTPTKYTIRFNGNGAESGSMPDMSCDFDNSYTLTANTFGCATTKYAYVKAADYGSSYDYDARTDVYIADSDIFTPNGKAEISYAAYNMVKSGTITVNWNIPDKTAIYK